MRSAHFEKFAQLYFRWYPRFAYVVIYISLALLITYAASPVHELNHAVVCKAIGLEPEIGYFHVDCEGVQYTSHSVQFLYFISPYIFYLSILILIMHFYHRHFLIKYFALIPALDILYNYVSAVEGSDFKFLLGNTYPNLIPFLLAMAIATSAVLITIRLIRETKVLNLDSFLDDFPILRKWAESLQRRFRRSKT